MLTKNKLQFLEEEAELLRQSYPSLTLSICNDGSSIVTGSLEIEHGISYTVELYLPKEYPRHEPILKCNKIEIPWALERHVFPASGRACLCVRSEIRTHWPWGSNLIVFIDKLVMPFFVWQNYYESYGHPPPSGERPHFAPGIIEAYTDILTDIKDVNEIQICKFMKLLARKKEPAGHELCPCLSGKKLRNCHGKLLKRLRSTIDPRHALLDMNEAFPKSNFSN